MTKKKISLYVEENLWDEFRRLAFQKHENFHGALSYELEEAMRNWLVLHTQNLTKQLVVNTVNPQPRVYRVFNEVKEYMKQKHGYAALFPGQQVPRGHLVEAIMAVRGMDSRTVEKWLERFLRFKLVKWVAGQVYEVV